MAKQPDEAVEIDHLITQIANWSEESGGKKYWVALKIKELKEKIAQLNGEQHGYTA